MERLGIELGGKGLDSLRVDRQRAGAKDLADGKVFEISAGHLDAPFPTRTGRPPFDALTLYIVRTTRNSAFPLIIRA
jgi:hypothetical protein